ncbi:MAG: hypothetical protein JXA06_06145 [Bacteroidetes bacterium]|nr:hypothetical protein [Bacteroidota bacterium]
MILSYTRFKDERNNFVHRPTLAITLYVGSKSIKTRGLLDTGADNIVINNGFGRMLGIDIKKLPMRPLLGINGVPTKSWEYSLDIEVDGLSNSRKTSEIRFIDSPSVGVLLGHRGFFENFKIKFETYALMFEIDFPKYS